MEAKHTQPKNKGQSVVEMAIMMPILVVIVVGLVEIGAILFSQMTVTNAAREGTRFGVAGGNDHDITLVAQEALSVTLNYNGNNANLYIFRGKTGADGHFDTSTSDLDAESYWYVHQTISGTTSIASSKLISPTKIESELGYMPDTEVLIVQAFYDHKSLLGLPVIDWLADQVLLSSYTLMRMESPALRDLGCRAYPIALHLSTITDDCTEDADGDGYCEMNNIMNGEGAGQFGWLRWSDDPHWGSAEGLEEMLRDPSLSLTEYVNPADSSDFELNKNDWVWGNTGLSAGAQVRDALDDLIGRYIRVPVWDNANGGNYHVCCFATVSLTDWDWPNLDWISAEFIRWDTTCQ